MIRHYEFRTDMVAAQKSIAATCAADIKRKSPKNLHRPTRPTNPHEIIRHYDFRELPADIVGPYKEKSVADTCAVLGIDIQGQSLKNLYGPMQNANPILFEMLCNKHDECRRPFIHLGKLPEEIQDIILNYAFKENREAINILRGCSGKKNPEEELSYEAAIKRFYSRQIKNAPFLTFSEKYYLPEEQINLCEHIYRRRTDKARLDFTQEQTLHAIPTHIKQRMVAYDVLCQRPYKERFWLAWGTTRDAFSSMCKAIEKDKPKYSFTRKKEDAWIEAFQFGTTLIFALSAGIYTWFSSKYDLSNPKSMKTFIKTEAP